MFSTPDEGIFAGRSNDTIELLKAWGGTTVAFAVFQTGAANLVSREFLVNLFIAAVVCGLGFVLHELAHRIVARRFGAQAHFVANVQMLAISIVVAFLPLGLFFAAPGAVWHRGYLTPRQSGLIALAGPATNMALAVIFLNRSAVRVPRRFARQLDCWTILHRCCAQRLVGSVQHDPRRSI
jgi:Zn-dependent protease